MTREEKKARNMLIVKDWHDMQRKIDRRRISLFLCQKYGLCREMIYQILKENNITIRADLWKS